MCRLKFLLGKSELKIEGLGWIVAWKLVLVFDLHIVYIFTSNSSSQIFVHLVFSIDNILVVKKNIINNYVLSFSVLFTSYFIVINYIMKSFKFNDTYHSYKNNSPNCQTSPFTCHSQNKPNLLAISLYSLFCVMQFGSSPQGYFHIRGFSVWHVVLGKYTGDRHHICESVA